MTVLRGEWRLVNGGREPVGTERWKLEESPDDFRWNSTIDKTVPYPHREEVNVTGVSRRWRIRSIQLSSIGGGREHRFEGTIEKDSFRVSARGSGTNEEYSLPVSASTEFDYLSLAFNIITFHRLRLRRDESREIEVAYIFSVSNQESFRTRMVRQRYQRLADEPISVPAGQFANAKHYLYKNLESGWTSDIWTDNLETVLRYEKLCELVSYSTS